MLHRCSPHTQGPGAVCQLCNAPVDAGKPHWTHAGRFVCETCAIPYALLGNVREEDGI